MRLLVPLLIMLLSGHVQAEVKFYGEARLGAGGVRHSNVDFYPTFGGVSGGLFLVENIGIEMFADTALSSYERDVFDVSITKASGAALRLQSPPERGLQAYVTFGFVGFTLEQEEEGTQGFRLVRQNFKGLRFTVGLQQRLEIINGLIFAVEYRNYYANSGITVDGVSAALRFEMP